MMRTFNSVLGGVVEASRTISSETCNARDVHDCAGAFDAHEGDKNADGIEEALRRKK